MFKTESFFLEKMDDCKLVMSPNISRYLKIDMYSSGKKEEMLFFEDNYIASQEDVQFFKKPQHRINVAMYNCIKSYFISINGQRAPILYSGKVRHSFDMANDKLMAIKRMINKIIHRFEIVFFNDDMLPYFQNIDLKHYPLKLTLVFMKPL